MKLMNMGHYLLTTVTPCPYRTPQSPHEAVCFGGHLAQEGWSRGPSVLSVWFVFFVGNGLRENQLLTKKCTHS